MFGVFLVSLRQYKYVNFVKEFQYILILIFLFGLVLLYQSSLTNVIIFNNLLCIDPLVLSIKFILLLIAICCLIISFNYVQNEKLNLFEYNILIILSVLGLLCFISANDFISFYLALDLLCTCGDRNIDHLFFLTGKFIIRADKPISLPNNFDIKKSNKSKLNPFNNTDMKI